MAVLSMDVITKYMHICNYIVLCSDTLLLAFTSYLSQDKSLTSDHHSHIPNMPGIVMEKRHKFQETKDDRDSAISIGSLSCDVPTHQLSATDLLLYPSQESVATPTGSAVHVVEYLQKKMSETTTPPDSPLGESGIGMSFHFRAHQDVYKHVDTNTQTQ